MIVILLIPFSSEIKKKIYINIYVKLQSFHLHTWPSVSSYNYFSLKKKTYLHISMENFEMLPDAIKCVI